MKWFLSFITLAALQVISATPPLVKRAAPGDIATVGYVSERLSSTTGGSGGTTTTVTTLPLVLTAAVAGSAKKIVLIQGTITGNVAIRVGANTSVIGKSGSSLVGVGLRVLDVSNVIIRNVKISKVLAAAGDALGVQNAHQVWIDHVDLSSDRGMSFLCRAAVLSFFQSKLLPLPTTTTTNLSSRTPSFRFGHGHIFNNVFDSNDDGINTRDGAQLLVENNVWTGTNKPLYATDAGFAVATGNDFGGATNTAPVGTFTKAPYTYTKLATASVRGAVAGQTLAF
ncbi:pectate lyase [Mycena rebaudengoi]|nr:pectate lyase [Mycena rebaudengoi]